MQMFCPWDVLSLGRFVLGMLSLGSFVLGTFRPCYVFSLGTFCPWDLMSWDILSLGPYVLGGFVPCDVLSVLHKTSVNMVLKTGSLFL